MHYKWYENGNLESKGVYLTGRRDGLWTCWHPNGTKKSEGHFKPKPLEFSSVYCDYRVGKWTEWHETGFKSSEGKYAQKPSKLFYERKIGIWQEWDEQGVLVQKMKYSKGRASTIYELQT